MNRNQRKNRQREKRLDAARAKSLQATITGRSTQAKRGTPLTKERPQRTATIGRTTKKQIRAMFEWLAGILTILAICQLFLRPTVQSPLLLFPGNPLSIPFEIKNENILPLVDVQYGCELLTARIKDRPNITIDRDITEKMEPARTVWGRQSMTARCDKGIAIQGLPIERAEYRLILSYFALPLPIRMHASYDFSAIADDAGNVVRWVPK